MPYLCAVFDNTTQQVIDDAGSRFAENSKFTKLKPTKAKFHIPLIGGLHVYTMEQIGAAVNCGSFVTNAPIEGRFTHWFISKKATLRIGVALASHEGLARVSSELSLGKEWRDELFVEVGSLASIDHSEWDAFIAAVNVAFPITNDSTFVCSTLDYVGATLKVPRPRTSVKPSLAADRPRKAKMFLGNSSSSVHKKWKRPGLKTDSSAHGATQRAFLQTTGYTGSIVKKAVARRRPAPQHH